MKRSFQSVLLMLSASAFTSCLIDEEYSLVSTGQEDYLVPFEVYADAGATKTVNSGMSTEWVAGDCISVFHSEIGSPELIEDSAFRISEEYLDQGYFTGALSSPLSADAYDWYFLYPYDERGNRRHKNHPEHDIRVVIGSEDGGPQIQKGNDDMGHIAGEDYPLYGKSLSVPSDQTPSAQMNHMASLVAVNVMNNTGFPINVTSVAFEADEPLVGTFGINMLEGSFSDLGDKANVSDIAELFVEEALPLSDEESSKYYMGVRPFTAEAGSKLRLFVNGASKTIRLKEDVDFTAGKIKTLNISVDSLVHPLTTQEEIKERITLDSTSRIDSGYVNGVPVDHIMVLGNEDHTGTITISGTIREFINMNEFGFFASSWADECTVLTIEEIKIEAEFMDILAADYIVSKQRLDKYLGLNPDVLVLKAAPSGNFNVSEGIHDIIILDEELHYYGLKESDVDWLFRLMGLSVDGLRKLFKGEDYDYIEKLQILAPEHLKAYFSVDMAAYIIPAILDAKISVKLTTLEKDSDGHSLDRRMAIWGMNVYYTQDGVDL